MPKTWPCSLKNVLLSRRRQDSQVNSEAEICGKGEKINKRNIRSTGPKVEGLARREYDAGTDRLSSDDACANIQVIVLRRYVRERIVFPHHAIYNYDADNQGALNYFFGRVQSSFIKRDLWLCYKKFSCV